uniref:Adipokinetic hormones n=1 Tax=Galleria mellonella TaxID=7137 RepID=A0A6J1X541_GALME|nr:adipokinetic hormones [Galleria mellonella]
MHKVILLVVVLVACLWIAEAQLTFTSSWGGKRSAITGSISCRNDESMAAIYKLIQNEAEKLIICQKP